MSAINLNEEGCKLFAMAVVESALKEYKNGYRDYRLNIRGRYAYKTIERFFHTKLYGALCTLNPDLLLSKIRVMTEREIKNKK